MPVLPDIDALGLLKRTMFEKAHLPVASHRAAISPPYAEGTQHALPGASRSDSARFEARPMRRSGEALRAVEWSEITARLNAARDLRLLLRTESKAPIEAVAASFGDAAASYFALLDDDEHTVNLDALGQSKALGGMFDYHEANRSGTAADENPGAAHGDAREMQ